MPSLALGPGITFTQAQIDYALTPAAAPWVAEFFYIGGDPVVGDVQYSWSVTVRRGTTDPFELDTGASPAWVFAFFGDDDTVQYVGGANDGKFNGALITSSLAGAIDATTYYKIEIQMVQLPSGGVLFVPYVNEVALTPVEMVLWHPATLKDGIDHMYSLTSVNFTEYYVDSILIGSAGRGSSDLLNETLKTAYSPPFNSLTPEVRSSDATLGMFVQTGSTFANRFLLGTLAL